MRDEAASDPSVKELAWRACKDFLGGLWKEIALQDFRIFEVRGGFSNKLYRCALPETAVGRSGSPKEVLLRIYGPIQDDPNVVVAETVTFMLLSERKLGPKLYGLFPKGRLEEFIPSHCLNSKELRDYSILTAREMAKIHALDVPVRKVPDIFQRCGMKWLDEVQEFLSNDNGQYFMSYTEYRKGIEWVEQEMAKTKSPVVYCHNDLQGGNVLYREDGDHTRNQDLILIDFEFGCYNYRSFDFANHFNEWCFDYDTEVYPHYKVDMAKFPTVREQIEFFTAYADQLHKEGVQLKGSLKEETESMIKEINLFASASHLLWAVWCAKMVAASNIGISHAPANRKNSEEAQNHNTSEGDSERSYNTAFKEHGRTRSELYRKFKEQYENNM